MNNSSSYMQQPTQPQWPQPQPQMRSGIMFGPGRSTRLPDPGTPEYQALLERVRNVATQS